jgi:RimJ/RimL family protein N-acetyltransferase
MPIEKSHSILFSKLLEKDIEIVRNWRNDTEVNRFFLNKKYITAEQQIVWFKHINPNTQRYFMVSKDDEKIGLFYLTNINQREKSCEPNGFIGNKKYLQTPTAGIILINFFSMVFDKLGFETLQGKVVKENISFINIHKKMGAEIVDNGFVVSIKLSKSDFKNFIGSFLS